MIEKMKLSGLGQFTIEDWEDFLALRFSLPTAHSKVLQTCMFGACAGRVRVEPSDYGKVAKIDKRAPWTKVALMLCQYIGTSMKPQAPCLSSASSFRGLVTVNAPKLSASSVKQLVTESAFVLSVEKFIGTVLATYVGKVPGDSPQLNASPEAGDTQRVPGDTPPPEARPATSDTQVVPGDSPPPEKSVKELSPMSKLELLKERGALLAQCGRHVRSVGSAVETAVKLSEMRRYALTPEERMAIVETASTGKHRVIEDDFRKRLVGKKLYTELDLPAHVSAGETKPQKAPSQAGTGGVKDRLSNTSLTLTDVKNVTEADVFDRLRIKGLGEDVMALVAHPSPSSTLGVKTESAAAVREEAAEDSPGVIDAEDGCALKGASWKLVQLKSIQLPHAVVEIIDGTTRHTYKVVVDDELRPVEKLRVKPEKEIVIHPTRQPLQPNCKLPQYSYTLCEMDVKLALAQDALRWLHMRSQLSVERVDVYSLNGGKSSHHKIQHVLQARASRAYKAGALVLSPGPLVPVEDNKLHRLQLAKACVQPSPLHAHMLKFVEVKVTVAPHPFVKPKRGDAPPPVLPTPKEATFLVSSPALSFGRPKDLATSLSNLPPFWAVLGCSGMGSPHNMELTHVSLTETAYEQMTGRPLKFPLGLILKADVPIMTNVFDIAENEVLCLPFGAGLPE